MEYSWEEVGKHQTDKDMWIVIDNVVYDVSEYLNTHPGGPIVLMNRAGKDATVSFIQANHSENAKTKILPERAIGRVKSDSISEEWQREVPQSSVNILTTVAILIVAVLVIYFLSS